MLKYAIIIPCFNEAKRILTKDFLYFLDINKEFELIFVDDGSTDNTKEVLRELSIQSDRVDLIELQNNSGKATAIYSGATYILNKKAVENVGYLDADLAIPFSELLRLKEELNNGFEFAYSSKKQTKGSNLELKFKRYFVGRVLSKMVRLSLKHKVYDSQCGCKLMTREMAQIAFDEPFISSWLFDVEIMWRIMTKKGREFFSAKSIEVPVNRLIDRGSSRIKISDLFSLPFEFLKIHSYYSKLQKAAK